MQRSVRTLAWLVLLVGIFQIGVCVVDCDCFALPSGPSASAHLTPARDADGCFCCGQYLAFEVSDSVIATAVVTFLPPLPALPISEDNTFGIDHPPRS